MDSKTIKCWAFITGLIVWAVWFVQLSKGFVGDHEFNSTMEQAMKGNVKEQIRLAQLYETGTFTAQNTDEAVYWYQLAAHNGSRSASLRLCNKYGKGVYCE